MMDARLLSSCNDRVVNHFVIGNLGAVLWVYVHGGGADSSGRGHVEAHECLLDVAGHAERNGVRDTVVLNGYADVHLEGVSVFGDLVLARAIWVITWARCLCGQLFRVFSMLQCSDMSGSWYANLEHPVSLHLRPDV